MRAKIFLLFAFANLFLFVYVAIAQGPDSGTRSTKTPTPFPRHTDGTALRPLKPSTGSGSSQLNTGLVWQTECVECPKYFSQMSDHFMRLDASGYPHMAYGSDHLYYAYADGSGWHYETVDADSYAGEQTSLALDNSGHPHIAYTQNPNLWYAYWDGAVWHRQFVASAVAQNVSIALDNAGLPYISYDDWGDAIVLVHFDGTAWQTITVEQNGDDVYGVYNGSLVIDASNHAQLCYTRNISDPARAGLIYAYQNSTTWISQTVDALGNDCSMVLNNAGRPQIAYSVWTQHQYQIRFASFDGATWQIQAVDGLADNPSLALDNHGYPQISYTRTNQNPLGYAYFDGSRWVTQTIAAAAGSAYYVSLDVNASGHPRMAYYNSITGELEYTSSDNQTSWQIQAIDRSRSVNDNSVSITLDNSSSPHFSFSETWAGGGEEIFHAYRSGSTWVKEKVDTMTNWWGAGSTSIALDAQVHPRILYDIGNYNIRYAYFDGTTWMTQTVTNTGTIYEPVSLRLDVSGKPHITFHRDYPYSDLVYGFFDGTNWITQSVDKIGSSESYSLALDAAGQPRISYYVFDSNGSVVKDLRYAYFDGTGFVTQTVDSSGDVGRYNSLALDSSGRPHISYLAGTPYASLRYASFDGTRWITQTVDDTAVPHWTSLGLDGLGNPNISYMNWYGPFDLKYASWNGTTWISQTVDARYGAGVGTAIAIDNQGLPHIGYIFGPAVLYTRGAIPNSISGRVADASNNAISGVSISDGAGHTATTDSTGNYTISGLTAGTYTITPSKSGYNFSPASRSATVPPDATGQNFTGSIARPNWTLLPLIVK